MRMLKQDGKNTVSFHQSMDSKNHDYNTEQE